MDWGTVSAGKGRSADTVPACMGFRRRFCWGVLGLPALRLSSVSMRFRMACVRECNVLHHDATASYACRFP